VHIPISSVMAIYAKENGQGMMFGEYVDEKTLELESVEEADDK